MQHRRISSILVCLAGFVAAIVPSRLAADGISEKDFEKLHRELSSIKEPWQTLPWQLSLIDAQRLAMKENKPIYMLCRSGHPLGCV